jgi:hypothetical protein
VTKAPLHSSQARHGSAVQLLHPPRRQHEAVFLGPCPPCGGKPWRRLPALAFILHRCTRAKPHRRTSRGGGSHLSLHRMWPTVHAAPSHVGGKSRTSGLPPPAPVAFTAPAPSFPPAAEGPSRCHTVVTWSSSPPPSPCCHHIVNPSTSAPCPHAGLQPQQAPPIQRLTTRRWLLPFHVEGDVGGGRCRLGPLGGALSGFCCRVVPHTRIADA